MEQLRNRAVSRYIIGGYTVGCRAGVCMQAGRRRGRVLRLKFSDPRALGWQSANAPRTLSPLSSLLCSEFGVHGDKIPAGVRLFPAPVPGTHP